MLKNTITIIFLLNIMYLKSQEINWIKTYGGKKNDAANVIKVSNSGNIYICGYYQDSISFGDFHLNSNSFGSFLLKKNSDGKIIWAKKLG